MTPRNAADDPAWAVLSEQLRRFCVRQFGNGGLAGVTLHLPGLGDARLPVCAEPWHSPDYQVVVWQGERYEFGPTQREVIKLLWEAFEAGRPIIDQASLLRDSGSAGSKLYFLFRRNPAWGKLIRLIADTGCHLAFAWIAPLAEADSDEPDIITENHADA